MTLLVKSGTNVLNSCLSCSRYTKCKDPHKSVIYSCERFKSNPSSEVDGLQRMFDMAHSVGLDPKADLDLLDPTEAAVTQFKTKEFNIKKQIHSLLDQDFITSPDIKIPEGDFPQAKNFFEFATAERYLNERPYPVQVLIATLVFGEYCPRCSDMDFLQQMPVDASYNRLQKKVAFLEHGKCPHCNATKDKLIRKYGLRFYNELAACAGQRSGKSILVAMMSAYITHWYIKLQKPVEVFGLTKSQVLHGTFVALTYGQAKDNLWDPYYGYIAGSPWFCLAEGSEISLASGGTRPIEKISVGDEVVTFEGCSVVDRVFDNGVKECLELTVSTGDTLIGTEDHQVQCLAADGTSLVWKRMGDLTADDFVVVS